MIFLDASAVLPLFVEDVWSPRARAALTPSAAPLIVSDFASLEVLSVLGRRLRNRELSRPDADRLLSAVDRWRAAHARLEPIVSGDLADAAVFLTRFELGLRAPDAIHLAACRRLGARLLTFDARMADAARALDVDLAA